MVRLSCYLLLQLLGWVALAVAGAAAIFLASQVLRVAPVFAGSGADGWTVATTIAWLLVPILGWALAPALVVAILAVFGRMEADGELTAIDAAGIPRHRLAAAPVALALALAGVAGWISLDAGPTCQRGLRARAFEFAGDALVGRARPGVFHSPAPGVTLYARGIEAVSASGRGPRSLLLEGVLLADARDESRPALLLAQRAMARFDPAGGAIEARLFEGTAFFGHADGAEAVVEFDDLTIGVDVLGDIAGRLGFIPGALTAATPELLGSPPPGISTADWSFALWRRIAAPVGLLALAAAALAIALSSRLRGRGAGVAAAAALFLGFHLAGRLGESLAQGGAVPAWLAALTPAVLLGLAACLAGARR
ncbi:MAG TPA: LptF/LptG family permease [Polyangia bacterium]|nr:LptF/LptG family permease [Polyangia bacterium]